MSRFNPRTLARVGAMFAAAIYIAKGLSDIYCYLSFV